MKKYLFILTLVLISATSGFAQLHAKHKNSVDMGLFVGGSYYIGDLNQTVQFLYTKPAGGLFYRYNFNPRTAVQVHFLGGSIAGNDASSPSPAQRQRNLNFKSPVYEFGMQWEFNFFNYRIGINKERFSPYIFIGLAGFYFNPQGKLPNGNYTSLQPLCTEGEGLPGGSRKKPYPLTQVSIPFGIGFKANLIRRVGFGVEWGMRKTSTDYLDDVHGRYYDKTELLKERGATAVYFSDRSVGTDAGILNAGRQRGNATNKDWYSFFGLTIYFHLDNNKEVCPTVN